MRICHFSDWHWAFTDDVEPEFLKERLPEADLYVCTGDMYANYPVRMYEEVSQPYQPPDTYWGIDREREPGFQRQAAESFIRMGGFRRFLSSPDAPIVCVRGNHDFMDLAPLFEGCNLLHEFVDNELVEWNGIRITGHRGIPWIYGTWNDEVRVPELQDRVRRMPEAEVFVTHYPPAGILDYETGPFGLQRMDFGLGGMAQQIWNKVRYERYVDGQPISPKSTALHCFGHIHGCGGRVENHDGFVFSNAAEAANVIDVDFSESP